MRTPWQILLLFAVMAILSPFAAQQARAGDMDYLKMDFPTLRLKAEQGDADAQAWLAAAYNLGLKDVIPNREKALFWWTKAAELGNPTAQFQLGLMYSQGEGVSQDFSKAYAWFTLAASQGDETATAKKDALAERMNPEQLEAGERLFRELRERTNRTD